MKTHRVTETRHGAPEAYLANGLVGLRIPPVPLPGGTALVSGFVGRSSEKGIEECAHAPYPVGADLQIGSMWLSERPDLACFVRQEYDFACGELRSTFTFATDDGCVHADVSTFCSRTQPALALQEVGLTVDKPCAVTLQAGARGAAECQAHGGMRASSSRCRRATTDGRSRRSGPKASWRST